MILRQTFNGDFYLCQKIFNFIDDIAGIFHIGHLQLRVLFQLA